MLRAKPARIRLLGCLLLMAVASAAACQCVRADPTRLYSCSSESDCAGLGPAATCIATDGASGVCCIRKTCAELERNCGKWDDGCGGELSCGMCGSGEGCGAAGVAGQCAACDSADAGDEPDDLFLDTNCDGIDGNAAESIFVADDGNPNANGTQSTPVNTLKTALLLAATDPNRRHILVSEGEYSEDLVIQSQNVSLHGGYTKDWQRSNSAVATVRALNEGRDGHSVRNCEECVIDRLLLKAEPRTEGLNSIGLTVENSKLSLRHVVIAAHLGVSGAPGEPGNDGGAGLNGGNAASIAPGDAGAPPVCSGRAGGAGGDPARGGAGEAAPEDGGAGGAAGNAGSTDCLGGPASISSDGQDGEPGAPGLSGADAVPLAGPLPLGAPDTPKSGSSGQPGWGGGGGGAGGSFREWCTFLALGGAGGGGGSGGCPGSAGTGGWAGGSSVALKILSDVHLSAEGVTLSTKGGGAGGAGAPGGEGGPGGLGGLGAPGTGEAGHGGNGGNGGQGGRGGAGAGGPGGHSVGIWCAAPGGLSGLDGGAANLDTFTFDLGPAGEGGNTPGGGPGPAGLRAFSVDCR
jgi:hypothetical protein